MAFDYASLVPESWRPKLGWDRLAPEYQDLLGEFGSYMFALGMHRTGTIDQIKYGGRLVILEDGSRWEVDSADEYIAESWGIVTRVAIIDDVMYNLDGAESIAVQEELD